MTATNGQLGAANGYAAQIAIIQAAVTAAADPIAAAGVAALAPTIVELERRRTAVRDALSAETRQLTAWVQGLPVNVRRRWAAPLRNLQNNVVGGDQGRIDAAETALAQSIATFRGLAALATTTKVC